jgi:hypothetical protein
MPGLPSEHWTQWGPRWVAGTFVGFERGTKGWRIKVGGQVRTYRAVKFFEDRAWE